MKTADLHSLRSLLHNVDAWLQYFVYSIPDIHTENLHIFIRFSGSLVTLQHCQSDIYDIFVVKQKTKISIFFTYHCQHLYSSVLVTK